MEEKLYRPEYRFLTQDHHGNVAWHLDVDRPVANKEIKMYRSASRFVVSDGARNENWLGAFIDMEAVDRGEYGYTFEDGILKRVPAEGGDPIKGMYEL